MLILLWFALNWPSKIYFEGVHERLRRGTHEERSGQARKYSTDFPSHWIRILHKLSDQFRFTNIWIKRADHTTVKCVHVREQEKKRLNGPWDTTPSPRSSTWTACENKQRESTWRRRERLIPSQPPPLEWCWRRAIAPTTFTPINNTHATKSSEMCCCFIAAKTGFWAFESKDSEGKGQRRKWAEGSPVRDRSVFLFSYFLICFFKISFLFIYFIKNLFFMLMLKWPIFYYHLPHKLKNCSYGLCCILR